jgi:hypothetical protein
MDRIDVLEEQVIALTELVQEMRKGEQLAIPRASSRHGKVGPLADVTYISYCSRLRKARETYKETQHPYWKTEIEVLENRIRASGREVPPNETAVVETIPTTSPENVKASDSALGNIIRLMSPEQLKEKLTQSKEPA